MKQRNLLVVSKGEQAPSTRYRALNYFPLLRDSGWQPRHLTDNGSVAGRRAILRAAADADAVLVLRRTPGWWYGLRLRRASRRLLFDFDDAIFLPRSGRFSGRPARFRNMIRRCDHVWAGNSYLAGAARRYNRNVTVLPTSIELGRYRPCSGERPGSELVLVWIGSRSTRKYLADLLPVLEAARAAGSMIRLKVIGDFALHSAVLPIDNVAWSQATETAQLAAAGAGIAPMRDDPWTRGKCGLKVLQYMASCLPVITSPFGVNRDLVEHGVTGFHAVAERDWIAAIQRLAADPALAAAMGAAGRARCEAEYTLEKSFAKLLPTLEG